MVNKVDGSYGGMLTKLLFHMLPDHYPAGSVYAHFPFLIPEFLATSMAKAPRSAGIRHLYDWDRPLTVQQAAYVTPDMKVVRDYERRLSNLHMPPRVRNEAVGPLYAFGYLLVLIVLVIQIRKPISDKVAEYTASTSHFAHLTSELIRKRHQVDHRVDIIEILNLLPVYWVGDIMVRFLMHHHRLLGVELVFRSDWIAIDGRIIIASHSRILVQSLLQHCTVSLPMVIRLPSLTCAQLLVLE
jgi:hypothetical protein